MKVYAGGLKKCFKYMFFRYRQMCYAAHFISVIPAVGMYIESLFYLITKCQTFTAI